MSRRLAHVALFVATSLLSSGCNFSQSTLWVVQDLLMTPQCSVNASSASTANCCDSCVGLSAVEFNLVLAVSAWSAVPVVLLAGLALDRFGLPLCAVTSAALGVVGSCCRLLAVHLGRGPALLVLGGGEIVLACAMGVLIVVRSTAARLYFSGSVRAASVSASTALSVLGSVTAFWAVSPFASHFGLDAAFLLAACLSTLSPACAVVVTHASRAVVLDSPESLPRLSAAPSPPSAALSPPHKPSAAPSPPSKPSVAPSPPCKPSVAPSPPCKPSAAPSPPCKPSAALSPSSKPSVALSPPSKLPAVTAVLAAVFLRAITITVTANSILLVGAMSPASTAVSWTASLLPLSRVVTGLVTAAVVGVCGHKRLTMALGAVVGLVALSIFTARLPAVAMIMLGGAHGAVYPLCVAVVGEIVAPSRLGTVNAAAVVGGNIMTGFLSAAVGGLTDAWGWTAALGLLQTCETAVVILTFVLMLIGSDDGREEPMSSEEDEKTPFL